MAADDPYKTKWGGDYASDKPGEDPYKTDWGSQYNSDTPDKGVYKTPGNTPSDAHGQPVPKDEAIADNTGKKKAPDREELSQKEKTGAGSKYENQDGRGFYKPGGSKASWMAKNRKKMLLAGAGSSLIIIPLILFLALLLPSLKLPQLAAEIEGYRLARLSRTFYKNASTLTAEQSSLAAGTESAAESATMEDILGKTTLGRAFNTFRPNAVIKNMKATGAMGFEYEPGKLGTQKLSAIVINGERIGVPARSYTSLSNIAQTYKDRLNFAQQIRGGVNEALDGSNYFVRSAVSKNILRAYGINLMWWERLGIKYKGDTEAEADVQALRDAEAEIDTPTTAPLVTAPEENAVEKAEQVQADCIADNACALQEVESNGLPQTVKDAIDKGAKDATSGSLNDFLSIANPSFAAAFPVCLAYDGSVETANAFLNSQNAAAIKTFFAVAEASDQEKSGDTTAEAVSAMNRKIGDIANSIPGQIAQNGSADTSGEVSPQAARSGAFSIFNVIFGSGTAATAANTIAKHVCPTLTNPTVAIGLAIGNILISLDPFGGSETEAGADAAAQSAGQLAKNAIGRIVTGITEKFTTRVGRVALKNTAQDYASSAIKTGTASEGLTYLSRMIVLAEMGNFISGMDSSDFANQADMGGTAYANQMVQTQQFGRPLTPSETTGVETADKSYTVNTQNQGQSTFERYFAISNPYSITGNIALKISGWKFSNIASFFTNIPKIFETIFSPINHFAFGHASAATSVNSDYGMVQFGWSNNEENLIDSNSSYDPLVNAQILADNNSAATQILDKYGKCFGVMDDGSGNAVIDPNYQIGNLLGGTSPAIKRDSSGIVQDDPSNATCSPSNLSYDSTDALGADGDPLNSSSHKNDLIFRWRLDQSYQNTLGELKSVQNVGGVTTP